uniref:Uncharacterized protein n=1 Tax=Arundo donax TaxID=35708 RepID=A0A0A8YB99_ARUDO
MCTVHAIVYCLSMFVFSVHVHCIFLLCTLSLCICLVSAINNNTRC